MHMYTNVCTYACTCTYTYACACRNTHTHTCSIFFDERVVRKTVLVNDSPTAAVYRIAIALPNGTDEGGEAGEGGAAAGGGGDAACVVGRDKQPYAVEPTEGFLRPYEQREVA